MPVERRIEPVESEDALVKALVDEYRLGEDSPHEEPRIILEQGRFASVLHVYVIWSKWAAVPQTQRSRIIMDALEEVLSDQELVRVTLAWGLTPQEWSAIYPAETNLNQ